MAKKDTAETSATEAPAAAPAEKTVKVEFLKGYRPNDVPAEFLGDLCWKHEPGAVAELPYPEAKRAVALDVAKVVLDGDAL